MSGESKEPSERSPQANGDVRDILCAKSTSAPRKPIGTDGAAPVIDADFPGGNILVDSIEDDVIRLRPDFRDSSSWFYWCFRARALAGKRVVFQFASKVKMLCPFGPAISRDAGATWQWLGEEFTSLDRNAFVYKFGPQEEDVRFSFSIPYLEANWNAFLCNHAKNPNLEPSELCRSEKNRKVELLTIRTSEVLKAKLLLTCRHHACESMASYVMEGILDAALRPFDEHTDYLARHIEIMAVPFVDKDGVEDGDQGKNRRPHDHNRDYRDESRYESVKSLRQLVPRWANGRMAMSVDLHCPHVNDEAHGKVFFVGIENQRVWDQLERFACLLEATPGKTFPYQRQDNIPYGVGWNTGKNYIDGKGCTMWCSEIPGVRLATTMEVPYSNVRRVPITVESARAFGRDVAQAIGHYLSKS